MLQRSQRIIIIGAGVAGLTCGRVLAAYGHQVTLFEAADGIGGRVRSDHVAGFTLDRGFQVLFDSYPAIQRLLDLPALALRRFDPGALIALNGQRTILTDPLRDRDPAALLTAITTPIVPFADKLRTLQLALAMRRSSIDEILAGPDTTTSAFLRQRGFADTTIDTFFRPFYGGIFLDRSLETSAKCFRFNLKMLSSGHAVLPAGGMGQIAAQLARPLLDTGCIRLHSRVVALLYENGRVVGVRLATGEEHHADAVIIATAAPDARHLVDLPLPADGLAATTIYFSGNRPIYRARKIVLNAAADALVNSAQLLTNVAPEYAPAGKHLLSVAILGTPALDDAALIRASLADLHRMFAGDRTALAALAAYQPLAVYRIPFAQFRQPPGIHPILPSNHTDRPGLYLAAEFTEASSINAAMISGEACAKLFEIDPL
ncbi:MAG TPA: NAD(P)/FAD-dependent oxidoreductase [Roseiflexaceae bacterium]|nr:NAD(P)/FAD-dependent oxidoreductase [Roseiflexaceae bacterium]